MIFEQRRAGGDRNFSYLIGDEAAGVALLVDPAGAPESALERSGELDLEIETIVHTHGHADHTAGTAELRHASGADLLVHEALAAHLIGPASEVAAAAGFPRRAHILGDILSYHTTPVEAAGIAAESEVGLLVLTHLVPAPDNAIAKRLFMSGVAEAWDGEVVLGEDGLHLWMPSSSSEIQREMLD